ncbi:MAG: DUF928 domain-containing protein [Cyanobacteria bacterium J06649_4]
MFKLLCTKLFLYLTAFSLALLNMPAHAAQTKPFLIENLLGFLASDFSPPEEGAPDRTVPAGSRDSARCHGDTVHMRPLMPEGNYGLTATAHPVIWMEMPSTQAQEILLTFKTEDGIEHSRTRLFIPEATQQGLVQLRLPETVSELTPGENYYWTISVLCQGYLNPNDPVFSGWVKRVHYSTVIAQRLADSSVSEQVRILQENGYWYDMLPLILQNQETFSFIRRLSKGELK